MSNFKSCWTKWILFFLGIYASFFWSNFKFFHVFLLPPPYPPHCEFANSQLANTRSTKLCGKPAVLVRRLAPIALAGAILGLAANPAQALTLFTGAYAPANWTQSIQGDGSINTSGAPNSISLSSADDEEIFGPSKNTDFTIAAPNAGVVSFDWAFGTADAASYYDPFGYLLNGTFTQLTNDGGSVTQSGSVAFAVLAGDVFGFRQNSSDSCCGRASSTISNFNVAVPNVAVPGPLPLFGAAAAFGYSRKLRKRIVNSKVVPVASAIV
jgi:hypothetical protein